MNLKRGISHSLIDPAGAFACNGRLINTAAEALMQSFELEPDVFSRLQRLMKGASGIFLPPHKQALVSSRLQKRVRSLGLSGFREYVTYLDQTPEERRLAIDLLTTNETSFFREAKHFRLLQQLLPGFKAPVRVWSAACSSGEEPYTLAMVMDQALEHDDWRIVASDLSNQVLEKARNAVYPVRQEQSIERSLLVRYCLRGTGEASGFFQIKPELRQRVDFACINLNEPLPGDLGHFDVIFIRNVLIYFDQSGKRDILTRVLLQLKPGGYLFVGHSESLQGLGLGVTGVAPAVYRKDG